LYWPPLSRGLGYSRRYQIFWEVVGLERGPLSLVNIAEELLEWKSRGSGSRKPRLTAVGIRCADHATSLYPQKLALTSPTSGGRSVGIVCLRAKTTEFTFLVFVLNNSVKVRMWRGMEMARHIAQAWGMKIT
jgi:hypothetical protein